MKVEGGILTCAKCLNFSIRCQKKRLENLGSSSKLMDVVEHKPKHCETQASFLNDVDIQSLIHAPTPIPWFVQTHDPLKRVKGNCSWRQTDHLNCVVYKGYHSNLILQLSRPCFLLLHLLDFLSCPLLHAVMPFDLKQSKMHGGTAAS